MANQDSISRRFCSGAKVEKQRAVLEESRDFQIQASIDTHHKQGHRQPAYTAKLVVEAINLILMIKIKRPNWIPKALSST